MDTKVGNVDENRGNLQRACKKGKRLSKTWHMKDLPPDVINSVEYNVTPLYERKLSDYITEKHYSLTQNETLALHWQHYKERPRNTLATEYFDRVDPRDYHFYNYYVRFMPSLSEHVLNKPRGFILRGNKPEVDKIGVVPLPVEQITMRDQIYRMGVDIKELDKEKRPSKGKGNFKGKKDDNVKRR